MPTLPTLRHLPATLAVDWGNPDTLGMSFAWTAADPFRNLVSGEVLQLRSGTTTANFQRASNSAGDGWQVASAQTFALEGSRLSPSSATTFSMLALASPAAGGGSLLSLGIGVAGNGNNILYTTFRSGATYTAGIFAGSYQNLTSSSAPSNSGAHAYGHINSVPESRNELWVDGSIITTGAAVTSASGTTFISLFRNSTLTGTTSQDSPVNLVLFWARALSPASMAALSARPYSVFQQRRWLLEIGDGGGGGGAAPWRSFLGPLMGGY